jgi:hypothetical protein
MLLRFMNPSLAMILLSASGMLEAHLRLSELNCLHEVVVTRFETSNIA